MGNVRQQVTGFLDNNQELVEAWNSLSHEVSENQRMRYGLWGIFFILLFYIGLSIQENRVAQLVELKRAITQEKNSALIGNQDYWLQRQSQSTNLYHKLLSNFHTASTEGAAKATLQELLQTQLEQSGFVNVRVSTNQISDKKLDSTIDEIRFWTFSASVRADFDAQAMTSFLKFLTQSNKHYLVERLEIGQQRKPKLTINLKYWFVAQNDVEPFNFENAEVALKQASMHKPTHTEERLIKKGNPQKELSADELLEELMKQ